MRHLTTLLAGILLPGSLVRAVETKTWTQSEAAEFEKGTPKGVSIASDGRVSLAPRFKEVYDAALPYLWSLAADSKGRLFAGGANGKLIMLDAKGVGTVAAEIPGGDIFCVAVNSKDEVFAAVSPEGKVYKLASSGKAALFYDSKEKYIWAMAFNPRGELFIATGDQGRIHRVSPDGKGGVFAETAETHVRSLAIDNAGNLIAGTEPGGLVIRITPKAESFVLYQTARREVTSIAVARDGVIFAAAAGTRQPAAPAPAPAPPAAPSSTSVPGAGAAQTLVTPRPSPSPPPPLTPAGSTVSGGSEIYRIETDGAPRRIWTAAQPVVYALAFDAQGHLIAATGNQGRIYRIDSGRVSTRLVDAEVTQFTALAAGNAGQLYAATANSGRIFQIGPGLEPEGTLASEVFDATMFTYWGRLRHEGENNGGSITMETRSGNLERQYSNWSPWTTVADRVQSPAARFLAWRATLKAAPDGRSPVLSLVEAAYVAKNVAPVLDRIEITPPNYRFPSASLTLSSSNTLSLPPIGQPRRSSPSISLSDSSGSQSMTYDKGSTGARWRASDANDDTLLYRVEIRGAGEKVWKPLKDELKESRYSWDSTGFADGTYLLRVHASDSYDNYPGEELTAEIESDPFLIDNTPPEITGLEAKVDGERIRIAFRATDALSSLQLAEYAINGGEWIAVEPSTRMTDSPRHDYAVVSAKVTGGEYTIAVRVSDERDNTVVQKVVISKP